MCNLQFNDSDVIYHRDELAESQGVTLPNPILYLGSDLVTLSGRLTDIKQVAAYVPITGESFIAQEVVEKREQRLKIYAIFGYPRPWLFNSLKEESKFKKMNRSNDPELFTDPQTPDFKRVTKFTPFAHYYGRTPVLPKWVNVIDERGFTPKQGNDDVAITDDNA